jgi:hypothetical protein
VPIHDNLPAANFHFTLNTNLSNPVQIFRVRRLN